MGANFGMQTMNQSLYELIHKGFISQDVALCQTRRTKELIKLLESSYA
jgi:Tfp pilus assembly ATPase PilU